MKIHKQVGVHWFSATYRRSSNYIVFARKRTFISCTRSKKLLIRLGGTSCFRSFVCLDLDVF